MKLGPTAPKTTEASDSESVVMEERWLRCVQCGGRVARLSSRVAINGAHEHDFMNPSAIRFRVACFEDAPGCRPEGERSTVWTWFPGYAWQIEICRSCGAHLGWSFHAEASFYGLITDRVASD